MTAVEWYDQALRKCLMGTVACDPNQILEDAKQLFKAQIKLAVQYGCSDWGSGKNAEQYYNETYGEQNAIDPEYMIKWINKHATRPNPNDPENPVD